MPSPSIPSLSKGRRDRGGGLINEIYIRKKT